jgi:ribosome-associated protein
MPKEMPPAPGDPIELAPGVSVGAEAIHFSFVRSSGPGGQAVNKLSTRAQMRIAVRSIQGLSPGAVDRLRSLAGKRLNRDDELVISASSSRQQRLNREACLERLRDLVARAMAVPAPRKPSRPTRGSVERRLESKRRDARRKASRREPGAE